MASTAHPALTAARRAPQFRAARLALMFFTLFAFALQTFVVQTHIHGGASVGTIVGKSAGQQPNKFPQGDDPANCSICQEMLHAGAYVAPTTAIWQPVVVATFIDAVVLEIRTITQTHSHGWKSRAPPRA